VGAEILIEALSGDGATYTVTTDANGEYSLWLPVAGNDYIVSVTAPDYEFGIVSDVVIISQGQTQVDFDLRLLEPCVNAAPSSLVVDVPIGFDKTVVLNIINNGAVGTDFEILEVPAPAIITRPAGKGSVDARKAPANVGTSAPNHPVNPEEILLTEGFEEGVMPPTSWSQEIIDPGYTWKIMVGTPFNGVYSADVEYDPALNQQDEWLLSPELIISEGTLSFWSMGSVYWCRDTYDNCDLNAWIVVGDVGGGDDILIGKGEDVWPDNWTWAQSTFDLTPLLPGGPVRIGLQYYGLDGAQVGLDDISLDGVAGSLDVPWLAEDPITGTVAHDSIFPVDVTFTVFPTMTGSVYTATLIIKTDDPVNPKIVVPVTMNVVDLAYGVAISPDDSLTGVPGETVVYAVTITNMSNGPSDSFTVSLGAAAWTSVLDVSEVGPLATGESAVVHVSVTVPEDVVLPAHDIVQVTATSQGDPTLPPAAATATLTTVAGGDFGVDLEPEVSAASGGAGDVITYTLRLTNTSTLADTIEVSVAGAGAAWTTLPQDTFVLAGGEAVDVLVVVTIPADAAVGDYPITVTAASMHDPAQTDDVAITTTVVVTQYNIYLPLISKAP
jgi:hypothetical protein